MTDNLLLSLTFTALLLCTSAAVRGDDATTTADPSTDTAVTAVTAARPQTAAVQADAFTSSAHPSDTADRHRTRQRDDIIIVKENLDTVFIFDKSVFRHIAKDWRKNIDIFRQRGYGISGTSMYGANAIFIEPVEELAESHPYLSDKRFNFRRFGFEPFPMSGGEGFIGLGDGLRLGGSGYSGKRQFSSNRFDGDSILVMNTRVSYGGFLIEKCFVRDRWNLIAGASLGAGRFKVAISSQFNTYFYGEDDDYFNESDWNDRQTAVFFLMEPHCGFSYSFFYFFHIGATVTLPAFMSLQKFNPYTDDFFTVNPGLYIRLVFGNIG